MNSRNHISSKAAFLCPYHCKFTPSAHALPNAKASVQIDDTKEFSDMFLSDRWHFHAVSVQQNTFVHSFAGSSFCCMYHQNVCFHSQNGSLYGLITTISL